MKVIKTIKPGQYGSRRFLRQYGERLVTVRYREDPDSRSVFTTVEIVVAQRDRLPSTNQQKSYAIQNARWVAVKIRFAETELREQARRLGARWSREHKVWVMRYGLTIELGLTDRVIPGLAARVRDV